ncbi:MULTISPECIES: IS110 family transposase [Methylomonas]|uniref:Uncharacterized protein n=1 Tax=Methylomonas denitrificans TaxID=1538553 RepID=A0A126T449_9GAMM|nr:MULTISPECIES: IS110 family transposase [Methylomonas]AMK76859.1 hypothetical protein JT25_010215 [Methylomonas denitrificans]OAI00975.1 hypothetical protein A1342_22225 [Methylomonas methanica]
MGIEACGGSHYWAREFTKLGHEVILLNARFVKAFVVGNKNDFNDADRGYFHGSDPPKQADGCGEKPDAARHSDVTSPAPATGG